MPETITQSVPSQALRMRVGPFALAAGEGDDGTSFTMLARSAEPIAHWWWGRIVHDFSGMAHRESIAVDYCHSPLEVIGAVTTFKVDASGLHLGGELIPFTDGDRASEVLHKGRRGVPYEASIDFYSDNLSLEILADGETAEVNGQQLSGPLVIVREWPLRGVAICPHGQDESTITQFAGAADEVSVTLFSKGADMAKFGNLLKKFTKSAKPAKTTKLTASEAEEEELDVEEEEIEQEEEETELEGDEEEAEFEGEEDSEEEEETEQLSKPSKQTKALQRFVAAFGAELGAKWFCAGVSFTAAQAKFGAIQAKKLERLQKQNAELATKLSQVELGEKSPVSGGSGKEVDPKVAKLTQSLGPNIGRAAAAIKIPGQP